MLENRGSPLLWFSEGFTSYYEGILLRRAGCISVREYLDELGRHTRRLSMTPGRGIMTLEESSIDTLTKFYHPHPDSPNTSISYYNKGSENLTRSERPIDFRSREKIL